MSSRTRAPWANSSSDSTMKRHLLAAFVLWHALAMAVSSLPSPGRGINRTYWSEPTVQAEMNAWATMLHADPATFQDRVHTAALAVQKAKTTMYAPFKPWLLATNTVQSWKMFVAPHRFPSRPEIQVRQGEGEWQTVYAEGDPTATWREERFSTERMRAATFAWGWPQADARWKAACRAFAKELFVERADIDGVRCQFLKRRSPSPEEVLSGTLPEVSATQVHVVKRSRP